VEGRTSKTIKTHNATGPAMFSTTTEGTNSSEPTTENTLKIATVINIVEQSIESSNWQAVLEYLQARFGLPAVGPGSWIVGSENDLGVTLAWLFGYPNDEDWSPQAYISLTEVKRNLAHIQGEVMWEFGIDGEFTETMFQWVRQIASTCSQSEINHVPETVDK